MLAVKGKAPPSFLLVMLAAAIFLTAVAAIIFNAEQARQDFEIDRGLHVREIQESLSSLHRDLEMVSMLLVAAQGDPLALPVGAYLTARRNEMTAVRWLGYLPSPQEKPQTLLGSAVTAGFDHRRDKAIQAMLVRIPESGLTAGVPSTYQEVASLALALPIPMEQDNSHPVLLALVDANIVVRQAMRDVFDHEMHLQLLLGDQLVARVPAFHQPHAPWHYFRISLGTEDFSLGFEEQSWMSMAISNFPASLALILLTAATLLVWAYRRRLSAPLATSAQDAAPCLPAAQPVDLDTSRIGRLWQMGEMSASLAHDLGQPLNIIRLTAENALDALENGRSDPERLRRSLSTAVDQSRRAQAMMDAMMMAARRPTEAPAALSPVVAIQNALAHVEDRVREQRINLYWQPQADCPNVIGHAPRLEAALRQLLTNACEAVALKTLKTLREAEQGILKISCHGEGGQVVIAITDNGEGFPPALRAGLATPFPEVAQHGKGCGLGLAIAFGVVAEMKGTLSIDDANPGTRVEICLPAAPRPDARFLLLVDDEPEATRAMADYLANHGWHVRVAGGGNEALTMFEQYPADAVVTDLHMAGGDGWTLIKRLRAMAPDLPIIAVTTVQGDEARQAVAAGAMVVLQKPASLDELAEELENAVSNG